MTDNATTRDNPILAKFRATLTEMYGDRLVLQPEFSVNFGMRRESQDDPRRCKALGDGARGGCGVDCAALWAGGATARGTPELIAWPIT